MARQDLSYQIAVNDAELRLATQHVAAFNAQLELSTVTGAKLDTKLRSVGRQTAQVGNFFTRNITLPLVAGGIAAAKSAASFDIAIAKIHGLAGATEAQTAQIRSFILALSSSELTQGPTALADAAFRLVSVGLSVNQTLAALKPISEAASGGLGDIAVVAGAVTDAMDAYGFSNLSAAQATAIMIEAVTKAKRPPEEFAQSIGRVIPIANSLGITLDQVAAGWASLTRQGLNGQLATTGLRAIFSTILKPANQTKVALASIGTNAEAVQESMSKIGVLPTLEVLRKKLGGLNIDTKTLVAAFNGNAKALDIVKTKGDGANATFSKLFPNVRALTAALILTGPRVKANAGIFADVKKQLDPITAQKTTKGALKSQEDTPIGQLNTQLSKLKANSQGLGDGFLKIGAKLAQAINGILSLVRGVGHGSSEAIAAALLVLGPVIAGVGRLTQATSLAVKIFGTWQERAQATAFALAGVNVEQDKSLIASRKATVVFETGQTQMQQAAGRTVKSLEAVRAAQARAVTGAGRASGATPLAAALPNVTTRPQAATAAITVEQQLASLQARRQTQYVAAVAAVEAAQVKLNAAAAIGATGQVRLAADELAAAKAAVTEAEAMKTLLFQDEQLLTLTNEIALAQERLAKAQLEVGVLGPSARVNAVAAQGELAALEAQFALRQKILAGQQVAQQEEQRLAGLGNTGSFARMDAKAQELAAANAAGAIRREGQIAATGWGTAIEGMKSVSKLGFDFIALTFGIQIAQKLVGNSAATKKAVTHDLFDIQKAGIGALGALSFGAVAFGPKIADAFTKLRGGVPAFEALGVATLNWRVKVGLALAGVVGLQHEGVKMETIFNIAFTVMAAKALLASTAIQASVLKVGSAIGAGGLLTTVGRTAAAFLGWETAAAVGAVLILNKIKPVHNVFTQIDSTVAGLISKLGVSRRSQFNFFSGLGDKDFNIDPTAGVVTATSKVKDLKAALQNANASFDTLPANVQHAAILLVQSGKSLAAQSLINAAATRQEADQIRAAAKILEDVGLKGPAALLQAAVNATKTTQTALNNIFKTVIKQTDNAFEAHTARMLDAFDASTNDILNQFDRQTSKMEDSLKVKVNVKSLHETFTVSVNGQTPAERELAALQKLEAKQNFQRDILSANQGLSDAKAIGDPVAIQQAEQKVQDAENERKTFILTNRAETERKAADAALKTGKQSLDDRRAQERQAISDQRAADRRDLEAARAVQEQQLNDALNAQKKLFDRGKTDVKTFYSNVHGIMVANGVTMQQDGHDAGEAYAKPFRAAMNHLATFVQTKFNEIQAKAKKAAADARAIAATQLGISVESPSGVIIGPNGAVSTDRNAAQQFQNSQQTAGVPTPTAIRGALANVVFQARDVTKDQRQQIDTAAKSLPSGQLNLGQYSDFLSKLPTAMVGPLEQRLQAQGFFLAAGGGVVPGGPPWHGEGPQYYQSAYKFFRPYAVSGDYKTSLSPQVDELFQAWIGAKQAKFGQAPGGFDVNAKIADYDMRGFFRDDREPALGWRPGQHFPDRWKTPYDTTFSRESQYATRSNPFDWRGPNLVNTKTGRIIFSPREAGGRVPGSGKGDTVPAMLTPGEIVLNAGQQRTLGGMIGMPGAGPNALFQFIRDRGARFGGGGVPGGGSGGISIPPKDLTDLERLLRVLAANAATRAKIAAAGGPSPSGIAGRNTSGAGFVRDVGPVNVVSRVNSLTHGLTRDQKLALELSGAQAQAHPFLTGLVHVTPTSITAGAAPHALTPGGSLSRSGVDQPSVFTGDITITVQAGPSGHVDTGRMLGDIRKVAKRAPRVRAVRPLAGRLGLN